VTSSASSASRRGGSGRPQESPNSPQVPPRNPRATSLPFLMSSAGQRGRRDGGDRLSGPSAQRVGLHWLCLGGILMIPSGLTSSVINRASPVNGYVRVRDGGLVNAVAQFLYDEAALLDEWRLDDWLALFHPEKARYLIPSPEDLSDDPATTLHLVNDSMTTLAGRVGRLKSKHAHAQSPRSRTRRPLTPPPPDQQRARLAGARRPAQPLRLRCDPCPRRRGGPLRRHLRAPAPAGRHRGHALAHRPPPRADRPQHRVRRRAGQYRALTP